MYDPESFAERLDRVLRDLGYTNDDGTLDRRRIARCVRDRCGLSDEQWPESRVGAIVAGRRTMTADDARCLAQGVGVPVQLLLWTDPPKLPRRRARSVFERLGPG
jgi:hypothetical protein